MKNADDEWAVMQLVAVAHEHRLEVLRREHAPHLSLVRVLDVVVWMRGGGAGTVDDPRVQEVLLAR